MDNAGVQKKETGDIAGGFSTVWDPFWFMRAVLNWGRSSDALSFDVKETDDAYVCKVKVKLALPDHADVARAKAKLDNGELTLEVPKLVAATPEPGSSQPRKRRATRNGSTRRRGARTRARHG